MYSGVPVPSAMKPPPMQLGGLAATPDLGPKVGDPGRRRPTVVVEDARLAQVSGCTYQTSHE